MKRIILLTIVVILSIATITHVSHASSVTIDAVLGTWDDNGVTRILPIEEVSFDIRYTNNSGNGLTGFANGYRVWTTGGTNFTPVSVEILDPYFPSYFDLVFAISINSDGIGSDTVGIGGTILGVALPNGYDTLAYKIITGGVQEGETLCIDSSSYLLPSGIWRWSISGGDIIPDWSGQICFTAVCPPSCIPPLFTNNIDTIKSSSCENISFNFDATSSELPISDIRYFISDGPGTIDSLTGVWTYSIPPQESGGYDTLVIESYDLLTCICNKTSCSSVLQFIDTFPADINDDCTADISDLVWLVEYMFNEGSPPIPLMSADMNGDGTIDIADLVWLVAFMFQGGPPPIG